MSLVSYKYCEFSESLDTGFMTFCNNVFMALMTAGKVPGTQLLYK